jgi:hypothetical protein
VDSLSGRLLRKESDENTLNQPRRPPAPRRSEAWQRRKMPSTHVDDLTGPALDADVSVLSESGTLHADDSNGAIRIEVVDEDRREGKKKAKGSCVSSRFSSFICAGCERLTGR